MADKKRNITGAYPGAGGAPRPKKNINPAGSYPGSRPAVKIASSLKEEKPVEKKQPVAPKKEQTFIFKAVEKVQAKKEQMPVKEAPAPEQEAPKERQEKAPLFSAETMQKYWKTMAYYSGILIASLLLSVWLCGVGNEFLGLVRPEKEVTVIVEAKKPKAKHVAKALKEADVINHPGIFSFYCFLKKTDGFKSGEFTVDCQSDYNQLIRAMRQDPANKDMVKFTIRPGYTQEDLVATLCDSLEYCEREELENVLQNYDFSEFSFLKDLPERNYRLEGYLYPGTYETYNGESPVAIVRRILSSFEENVLTEENQKLMKESDLSLDEIITLSSILQKEGGKDLKKAAGVLYNRLADESDPFLQSQATVAYILPADHGAVTKADTRTSDPYNTYKEKGLPPGPIANPDGDAIAAVLEPKETDAFYFVTREDGEMTFAKSRSEHLLNLKKAGENLRGIATVK
jgi:UPF0755 protein